MFIIFRKFSSSLIPTPYSYDSTPCWYIPSASSYNPHSSPSLLHSFYLLLLHPTLSLVPSTSSFIPPSLSFILYSLSFPLLDSTLFLLPSSSSYILPSLPPRSPSVAVPFAQEPRPEAHSLTTLRLGPRAPKQTLIFTPSLTSLPRTALRYSTYSFTLPPSPSLSLSLHWASWI